MSDLTPVGHLLVSAQAAELPFNASAAELRARHEAVQSDFKRHRDTETLGLQMAWLCLIAIERVRQMEESHAGDLSRGSGRTGLGPRPAHRSGGWLNRPAADRATPPNVRPH